MTEISLLTKYAGPLFLEDGAFTLKGAMGPIEACLKQFFIDSLLQRDDLFYEVERM